MPQSNAALGRLLVVIGFGWVLLVTFVPQLLGWAAPVLGLDSEPTSAALLTAISAGLVAGPLLLGTRLLPHARWRAALESWTLAALVPLALAPTRLIVPADSQLQALAQAGALLGLALLLWRIRTPTPVQFEGLALALAAAGLLAMPWLASGAFG
ncbi:MAG: hypothetical protein H7Z42_18965, partial [Roseiflexaceae bacterium]|nr:hypothetical protein [Roseiflexaceae bacterium]